MLPLLRKAAFSALVVLALGAQVWAAVIRVPSGGAPVTRLQFQAVVSGQLREYASLTPEASLRRLATLSALPAKRFPALAVERAAAQAALALIVSPNAAQLRDDRETRIRLSRALGEANVELIATVAEELRGYAAVDPALSALIARLRERFAPREGSERSDIAKALAALKEFFDQSSVPGYASVSVGDAVDGRSILIPVRRSGLVKPARRGAADSGLVSQAVEEGAGFVTRATGEDGRVRTQKVYPRDGLTFERREIPAGLADAYEELPGGALRQRKADPLMAALAASKIDLWTVRHGETESNRARLAAGRGTDAPLTRTPNEKGVSGESQARAAALKMYESLGGDSWARAVSAGIQKPVVILTSPMKRARQTAAAFAELLDYESQRLGGGSRHRLYETHVERGLAEIAFGDLEGWTLDKAKSLGAWPAFDGVEGAGRTFLDRFPKGESRLDVMIRQRAILRRVIKKYPGRQVVTFAHFETVTAQKAVLGLLDRDPADRAFKVAPIANAEPIRLSFAGARLLSGQ